MFSKFFKRKNKPVKNEPKSDIMICANCGKRVSTDDKYCRICGTETAKSKPYNPEQDGPAQCIYGPPPVLREHKCAKCGYTWTTNLMIDNQNYCPKCGSPATVRDFGTEDEPIVEPIIEYKE